MATRCGGVEGCFRRGKDRLQREQEFKEFMRFKICLLGTVKNTTAELRSLLVGAINQTRQLTIKGRKLQQIRNKWETVHHPKAYELLCAINLAFLKRCPHHSSLCVIYVQFEECI